MVHSKRLSTDATTREAEAHELTEEELDRAAGGGEAITFNYGSLSVQYVQQHADGSSK